MASNEDRSREPFSSFVGIGFESASYYQDTGSSALADAPMHQIAYPQQQQRTTDGSRHDAPDTPSFVAAHVLDPQYRYYSAHDIYPPPRTIKLPSVVPAASSSQPWAIQSAAVAAVAPMCAPPPEGPSPPLPFDDDKPLERRGMEELHVPLTVPLLASPEDDLISAQVQLARDRAMKIMQRINQNDSSKVEMEVSRKRKESLEQLEKRKRLAMIKNLEYLAKTEDDRLKAKLLKMQQAQDYQCQLESYHSHSLQARLQTLGSHGSSGNNSKTNKSTNSVATSQAGIGTQQSHRAEERRRKLVHLASSDTVAIYVSNLPTDGSANEELLQALFGCFGFSIRKIHFYINRQTGELKGDALVVYELPSGEDRNTLTETVCSQLQYLPFDNSHQSDDTRMIKINGAELPCGTALKVEPSDPLYKIRKQKESSDNHYGPASQSVTGVEKANDLDDFFVSLVERHEIDAKGENEAESKYEESSSVPKVGDEDEDDLDDFFESFS